MKERVAQVERLGRLKRFCSPQLVELIVAGGADAGSETIPLRRVGHLTGAIVALMILALFPFYKPV